MSKKQQMIPALNRIVVGDVGSGKTIVGFISGLGYLHGVDTGVVALLAPTEVLAWQHYQGLLELLSSTTEDLDCIYVAGKTQAFNGEKLTPKKWREAIESSPCKKQFWIGTHALLFQNDFHPQLVMVDEQHRFGVHQRKQLALENAHYLSFSATPIPRTLALTVYKHLKPLYLERLPGRVDIATEIKTKEDWGAVIDVLKQTHANGKKSYIVCPQIVDNQSDIWSVTSVEESLNSVLGNIPLIVIHGKQKNKKQLLADFATGGPAVLIATSVIEVGVDVSDAITMIIVNAERFGLASLHQIRGRVGRNKDTNNRCILVTEAHGLYNKRLQALTQTQNGIELAQFDLELRGSGQLLGTGQSGVDEIQDMIGLEPENYEQICVVAEDIAQNCPKELHRLQTYIDKKVSQIWEE